MEHDTVDAWYERMEEHKRLGHKPEDSPSMRETLRLIQARIQFWEKNHRVPTKDEIRWGKQTKLIDEGGVDK